MKTIKADELKGRELEVLADGTLRLIENKSKKFIPNVGEEYWYLNYGEVIIKQNQNSDIDNWIINHQLVFRTEKECKEYKEFLELLDKYKCELNWEYTNKLKFYLCYGKSNGCLDIDSNSIFQTQGAFYFKSEIDAEEFIDKAGEDNIKKFMFDIWD